MVKLLVRGDRVKRKILSLVVGASLTFGMAAGVEAAKDTDNHWSSESVNYLYDRGVTKGYSDGTFRPDNSITRAEFVTFVNKLFGFTQKTNINFKDVKSDAWYYDQVAIAVKNGYVDGYSDNSFRPENKISRQEVAKIIAIAGNIKAEGKAKNFSDQKAIGSWAKEYVDIVSSKNYMSGYGSDGSFRPKNETKRGEAAKIIASVHKDVELEKKLEEERRLEEEKKKKEEEEKKKEENKPVEEVKKYTIQIKSGNEGKKNELIKEGKALRAKGYKDVILIKDEYNFYYLLGGIFESEGEANKLMERLKLENYQPKKIERDLSKLTTIDIDKAKLELSKKEEFKLKTEKLSDPSSIGEIKLEELLALNDAKAFFEKAKGEDLDPKDINKMKEVDLKLESLKTDIMGPSKTEYERAQVWAIKKGAHKRFVDIAPVFWDYGKKTNINPEVLYAQAAKETAFGNYTGSVKPHMNNWAGIKTNKANGDKTYDHEIFASPEDGVRGQFNHMGIYVGVDPIGTPHDRWYVTSKIKWAGTVKKVEDLGGRWAPHPDYGLSIMRDYVRPIYKTEKVDKSILEKAKEISDRIEEIMKLEEPKLGLDQPLEGKTLEKPKLDNYDDLEIHSETGVWNGDQVNDYIESLEKVIEDYTKLNPEVIKYVPKNIKSDIISLQSRLKNLKGKI